MGASAKRLVALFVAITLFVQLFAGCSSNTDSLQNNTVKENIIEESLIYSEYIPEEQIQAEYIAEHLIYEEGIYEITIGEQYICQTYLIEVVITSADKENFVNQLPQEVLDYGIDWAKVISKFAVGTSVIIAVGVVNHHTKGATAFMFGTVKDISKEAFIGGVIDAVMNVVLNCEEDNPPFEKVAKYAIEGFADGYMWGAISAVAFNYAFPKQLVSEDLGKLKVDNSGNVRNKAGEIIGKALYDLAEDQITLLDDAGRWLGSFKSNGDEIRNIAKAVLKPNAAYVRGVGDDAVKYFTDASGKVFRIGDDLAKNATYTLNGYVYQTDDLGRIVKVAFDKLTSKPEGRVRKTISSSMDDIGKGYQQLNDQRGHIIGDRFNGDESLANMVPMSPKLNQSEFKHVENIWAEAIEDGHIVSGVIELVYDEVSFRPGRMDVVYYIGEIVEEAAYIYRFYN